MATRLRRFREQNADARAAGVTVLIHAALLLALAAVVSTSAVEVAPILTEVGFAEVETDEPLAFLSTELPEAAAETDAPQQQELAQVDSTVQPPQIGLVADTGPSPAAVGGGEETTPRSGGEIARRVARAGGKTGEVQFSLAWDTRTDLDLHVLTPKREHIFFRQPRVDSGGFLDVDMNVQGESTEPVENVQFSKARRPVRGRYKILVDLYRDRSGGQATKFTVRVKIGQNVRTVSGSVHPKRKTWTRTYTYR